MLSQKFLLNGFIIEFISFFICTSSIFLFSVYSEFLLKAASQQEAQVSELGMLLLILDMESFPGGNDQLKNEKK